MRTPDDIGSLLYLPEGPRDLGRLLERSVEAYRPAILTCAEMFLTRPGADGLLEFEEEVLRLFMKVASQVVAGAVACVHMDPGFVEAAVAGARERTGRRLRNQGLRMTPVRFLGGTRLLLPTPYLAEDLHGRRGPRRGHGRRGPTGSGSYPALEALGIWSQATPALASEVSRQAVRAASFEEAQESLADRGINLDEKSVWRLAHRVGEEALSQREVRIQAADAGVVLTDEFAGERIVLSTDGGRIRCREGGDRGRRNRKRGRHFRTPWREPKLVTAYVIDAKGRRDPRHLPLYDGTMGDADRAFQILVAELKLRGAAKAKAIILTADGARWIWDRADELARALGLSPDQIVKVADFYHAVEHLAAIAELKAGWTESEKNRWVRRMRRHLRAGRVETVIAAARALCKGRNGGKIGTEVRYFASRKELMRYDRFEQRGIPLGSGAVESAIRRVVNLRMKGPSIFWRGENAERMLHLRCYLKAGRWDEVMRRVLLRSASGELAREAA
jgi:hypothetical protein